MTDLIVSETLHTCTLQSGRVDRKNYVRICLRTPRPGTFGTPARLEYERVFFNPSATKQHRQDLARRAKLSRARRLQFQAHLRRSSSPPAALPSQPISSPQPVALPAQPSLPASSAPPPGAASLPVSPATRMAHATTPTPPLGRSSRPRKAVVRSGPVANDVVSPGPVLPKQASPRLAISAQSVTPPPARSATSVVACI